MPAKVFSAAIIGLDCQPVEVEVDMALGLHHFQIVGLPDTAIKEAKERVSAAIKNSSALPPQNSRRRVTVNLAPADLKKEGPAYDLAIALAYLLASDQLKAEPNSLDNKLFVGELALNGETRPISGILSIALMAQTQGFKTLFVPTENAAEAALIKNLDIISIHSLTDLIDHLEKTKIIPPSPATNINGLCQNPSDTYDFAYIKGQEHVKRALEIAAAGRHNLLMKGSPGSGKTLLARALPSILPRLDINESLEVTKIFSVTGYLAKQKPLIIAPPFRAPHHTASIAAMVGGGSPPKPGEITLAHRGILFLDEFPEFPRSVLEALRQPLEDGIIAVSRATGSLNFPAKFMLIAAMNPCPCGRFNDPELNCSCSPPQIIKYQRRISEPLLDRIDLHIEVPRLKYHKLAEEKVAESSKIIKERVEKARAKQKQRYSQNAEPILTNNELNLKQIKKYCELEPASHDLLKKFTEQLRLSARAFYRVIKVSRTIADLANEDKIKPQHLAEALQYRTKETF